MQIAILTKNPGKRMAAKAVFDKYKVETFFIDKDYPEIQANSSLEIARSAALQASKELNIPIIREDHSFFINSLGMPGPYTSYIEKRISAEKLLKILEGEYDRTGYFEVATVYAKPDGFVKEYVYQVPVKIAEEERGDLQNGWNRIIMLEGEDRTLAEYPEKERIGVWNKNYEEIAKWLSSDSGE
jgi:XTP/dITP diphosphohydrolase